VLEARDRFDQALDKPPATPLGAPSARAASA
jgi:hypothetical protein